MKQKLIIHYTTELQRAAIQLIFDHLRGNQGCMPAIQHGHISYDECLRQIYFEDFGEYTHEIDVFIMAMEATLNMRNIIYTILDDTEDYDDL